MFFKFKTYEPIDRAALSLILVLNLAIGLLIIWEGRSLSKVRDFSWQNKQIGAKDTAFVLTFSRPMDRDSVEANLRIEPALSGKKCSALLLVNQAQTGERFFRTTRYRSDRSGDICSKTSVSFARPIRDKNELIARRFRIAVRPGSREENGSN